MKSNRDEVVYDFQRDWLEERIQTTIENYNQEVDRFKRLGKGRNVDDFVDYSRIKWSSGLKAHLQRYAHATYSNGDVRQSLFRPFTKQWLYYGKTLLDRPGLFHEFLPAEAGEAKNEIICLSAVANERPFYAIATNLIPNLAFVGFGGACQCFPFYVYDEDGTNRRENITDWALKTFREQYKDKKIDKWAIFYYVYGLLHHPGYREKFADNLKRELPRIPLAPDFRAFAKAGEKLAKLHLDYEKLKPWDLEFVEAPGVPLSYRVEDRMRLSKDKLRLTVNPSLTLTSIPPKAFNYRLGNRSALEWVIDQYQVSTDKRSGITSDPNREDDPDYIVRLVGQVIRVSMETVEIAGSLPAYAAANV
jgi:predicted helicase